MILLIIICTCMSFIVSTTSLMCYVCGCPGGGGEEGAERAGHHKQLSYSDCSGQCDGRLFCHGDGNSTPVFGAVVFCTSNNKDFRTPLMLSSSSIPSTYSSQKRSSRWNNPKREIMDVIEVDQLEDTNNKRLR